MLLCPGPNDKLQLVTSGTAPLRVHVSGLDVDASGNVTTYRKNLQITTATTTDISDVAASGVTRNIKTINVFNNHASVTNTIIVRHTDGTTIVEMFKTDLLTGRTLVYVEGKGWLVQ